MWRVFYAAVGAGLLVGVLLYAAFLFGIHTLMVQPIVGVSFAALSGLLIGFSYYLFFKFLLRSFTWPFLRQAQALTTRPITSLPPIWESSEIDKLEEVLTEALATLERLDLFSSIARDVVASLDQERTLGRIVGTAVETLPADSGLVFILDQESQRYEISASYLLPISDEQIEQISFAVGEGVPGWVATKGEPLMISDAHSDERVHPSLRQAEVQSLLSVPLSRGQTAIGVLNLFNHYANNAFDDHDLHLLRIYADLAAIAIDNSRLYRTAEDERSKLEAVLSDTTDAVIVLDQSGKVLLMNAAAGDCLGVAAQNSEGASIESLGVPDLNTALDAARTAGDSIVREMAAPGERILYGSVSPVSDVGWVIVMQDVTPLKELDRLRTEWVAAVSHDLKNPITAIEVSADMLERGGPLSEFQTEMLATLRRGGKRLRTLVTDVLDLARLEAGPPLRTGSVALNDIATDVMIEMQAIAEEKGLNLTADFPSHLPPVRGDAALLTRVMANLLSNAIKYTPSGGSVTARARPQNGEMWVEVRDTGVGIPSEAVPHLFEPFYRVPGSEERAEGTGLGLNIVKSIVDKHKGRLWVDSQPGQGSTFAFAIPVSEPR
jgi:PAS domain S-box-containing protein